MRGRHGFVRSLVPLGAAATLLVTSPAPLAAQRSSVSAPPSSARASGTAGGGTTSVQIGLDVRRDRLHYRFTNPSTFDTPAPVPHAFDQRYVADNVWATVTLRYTAGVRWETRVGATPQRTATGEDYDTFFDPGGVVIVAGTTGGVSARAWRFSQRAEVGRRRFRLVAGYRLQIDHFAFQLGHKTVTRNGTTLQAFDVTSPETTSSQLHEVFAGLEASRTLGGGWRASLEGDVSPASVGRLAIQLPEKYPGQTLVYGAKAFGASTRVTLARGGRWPVEVSVDAGRLWSYGSSNVVSRDQLGVSVSAGRAWR